MRNGLALFVTAIVLASAFGSDRPAVRSLYVEGNNDGANTIRKMVGNGKACFTLSSKKDEADAVLEVSSDKSASPLLTYSGLLTDPQGKTVWSGSRGAPEGLLHDLKKAVCLK